MVYGDKCIHTIVGLKWVYFAKGHLCSETDRICVLPNMVAKIFSCFHSRTYMHVKDGGWSLYCVDCYYETA